jgi:2-desacetyl-2-hydroxyethyl bacteriochlorophyllide A dehydrogenase
MSQIAIKPGGSSRATGAEEQSVPDAAPPWPRGVMRAVVLESAGRIRLSTVPIPEPRAGTALVRVRHVGLCGTDLELLHGMTSYQRDGRSPFPHVPGHEWSGVVVAVASGTTTPRPGDRVTGQTMIPCGRCETCGAGRRRQCPDLVETGLYGLQGAAADYARVPASSLVVLPDAVSDLAAPMIEPAVTVVEALDRAALRPGEVAAVVGTGTIGLLAVQLAARIAGRVDAVGVDAAGLDLARSCGAASALTPRQAQAGAGHTPAAGYPVVVEASGTAAGFCTALALTARGGRIAAVGVVGEPVSGFTPGDLVLRGIDVLGIQHGLDHYPRTIALLAEGALDPESLIAGVYPAERAPEAFRRLASGRSGPPKILLSFATTGELTP